jgi:hypothetical protein
VRIVAGNFQLAPNSSLDAKDYVAPDDFIYGEPVPESATWLLLAAGLATLAWLRGKRAGL